MISVYIAVSQFAKSKFVEYGFPSEKIIVKPNFVLGPTEPMSGGDNFLFVGRLSVEKGIRTLLEAMRLNEFKLKIIGDGPLADEVRSAAAANQRIQYLGRLPQKQVLEMMGAAKCLIFPSEWYETFGRVAAEAFAVGTPVIASRLGAVAEIVGNGRTGYHFTPGDPQDLARMMTYAHSHPDQLAQMRLVVRQEYEAKYTADRNYELLLAAYQHAIKHP